MQLIRVALAVPLFQLFDYLLPQTGHSAVIGARVVVPFGPQKLVGIIVALPEQSELPLSKLKPAIKILDEQSIFTPILWKLLNWAAEYYQSPLGEVLLGALPVKLREGEKAQVKAKTYFQITSLGQQLLADEKNTTLNRAKKQKEALVLLNQKMVAKGENDFTGNIWAALKQKGLMEEIELQPKQDHWQDHKKDLIQADTHLTLNKEQALALSQLIFHEGFGTFLLDGVTGSGKTEVYLQHIEEILKQGKQVLVLVPEIGLTPQMVRRFKARFNVPIDVWHSQLNDTERLNVWLRARDGQSAIVIGTRSALFTPFQNLGLIVVDEEHDRSFKQQDSWRYHGRDLAVIYGKFLNIPVVLGSATPSLETLNNVNEGKYRHLVLSQRAGNSNQLQHFVINMKNQPVKNGVSMLLLNKMQEHLAKGNQVLLFLNRRGFAPVLLCHECGWIAQCPHCDKPYTYHQHQRILRCHYCGAQKAIPMQCGDCGSTYLITTGLGTEQLEATLQEYFPQYEITRIDRDSTARKGSLEKHLHNITQGKSQILIGTQMLAKGHHFPNVTLVALLNIDGALFSVDFRAEEQLAQLYVQVAGRAGRALKAGEVVLQTHYPEHPLLVGLLSQGYNHFANETLKVRKIMGLPPHSSQVLFKAQSRDSADAEQLLQQIADFFAQQNYAQLQILGPLPAPLAKKAGQYRWQLLLQHHSRGILQQAVTKFRHCGLNGNHKVKLTIDVDPLDLT